MARQRAWECPDTPNALETAYMVPLWTCYVLAYIAPMHALIHCSMALAIPRALSFGAGMGLSSVLASRDVGLVMPLS